MTRSKVIAIINGFTAIMITGTLFAANLQTEHPLVVLKAGETIKIPLSSAEAIASDLTASGAFAPGDVTFTPGPECHLSADNCTLWITAAPTSKSYIAEPVMVSASAKNNTATFPLTVIQPEESLFMNDELAEHIPTPLILSHQRNVAQKDLVNTPTQSSTSSETTRVIQPPLQRSGNALFYAVAEPRPSLLAMANGVGSMNGFTAETNGPVYQIVSLTNNDVPRPLSVSITGPSAASFSIDDTASHYGANQNCAAMTHIDTGRSCLVIVKGKIGDPRQPPKTATLTIQSSNNNVASFTLTNTTYVYAAGGFNRLGSASVSGGDLLAQCTAGSCSNALQGVSGNNYASVNYSRGNWINALSITPTGNLMVGGTFGAIGGATSGSTGQLAALLAQCTPGSVSGNACMNQISGSSNTYAFKDDAYAYIDALSPLFSISGFNYIALGGEFNRIRNASVLSSGRMLAECQYNGTSPSSNCANYMSLSTTKFANNAISALNTFGSTARDPFLNVGGLFTQIASYPSSAPSTGTSFASCKRGVSGACSKGMGSNNPNDSILGMADDGANLYMGGAFTAIGGYVASGSYPLVKCTPDSSVTTCSNALSGNNAANGYIEGLAYSGGILYVGGRFSTIGGATPVTGGNMLAACTPDGGCSNFLNEVNPYASGVDWGGNISAIAIGDQVSITAH